MLGIYIIRILKKNNVEGSNNHVVDFSIYKILHNILEKRDPTTLGDPTLYSEKVKYVRLEFFFDKCLFLN